MAVPGMVDVYLQMALRGIPSDQLKTLADLDNQRR